MFQSHSIYIMAQMKVTLVFIVSLLLWKCVNGLPLDDVDLNSSLYNVETPYDNSSGFFIINIIDYKEENDADVTPASTTIGETLQKSFRISKIYEVTKHIRLSIDICFLFGIVILIEAFHLFCLEYLIRMTRTRFANHKRYNLYSTLSMILACFISLLNLLLVILFYKSIDFCY